VKSSSLKSRPSIPALCIPPMSLCLPELGVDPTTPYPWRCVCRCPDTSTSHSSTRGSVFAGARVPLLLIPLLQNHEDPTLRAPPGPRTASRRRGPVSIGVWTSADATNTLCKMFGHPGDSTPTPSSNKQARLRIRAQSGQNPRPATSA